MPNLVSVLVILCLLTLLNFVQSATVTCNNNGPCSYTGSGDDYVCSNNGYCDCGNSVNCHCDHNNGYCSCANAQTCQCDFNNGDCCYQSTTVSTSTNNGQERQNSNGQCMLSAGAIVGIVFGCLAFIAIIVILSIWCRRYRYRQRMYYATSAPQTTTGGIPVAQVYNPTPTIPTAIPLAQPLGQQYPTSQQYPTMAYPTQQPYSNQPYATPLPQTQGQNPYYTTPQSYSYQPSSPYNPSSAPPYNTNPEGTPP